MTNVIPLLRSIESLTYTLMPGKPLPWRSDAAHGLAHDRVFQYWREFWEKIYADAGTPESFVTDDFLRQDLVAAIHCGDELVGAHLYSVFPLEREAARAHRYFRFYPPEFFDHMRERGAKLAMSMEFLTVAPAWRKTASRISFGEILIGCGLRCMTALGADVGIAPARTDNKVNDMAYKFGFECFQAGVTKRNFTVDLVAVFKDKARLNPDPRVAAQIDSLWARRDDRTGITLAPSLTSKERTVA